MKKTMRKPSEVLLLAMPEYKRYLREDATFAYLCPTFDAMVGYDVITSDEAESIKACIDARLMGSLTLNGYAKRQMGKWLNSVEKMQFWHHFYQELRRNGV